MCIVCLHDIIKGLKTSNEVPFYMEPVAHEPGSWAIPVPIGDPSSPPHPDLKDFNIGIVISEQKATHPAVQQVSSKVGNWFVFMQPMSIGPDGSIMDWPVFQVVDIAELTVKQLAQLLESYTKRVFELRDELKAGLIERLPDSIVLVGIRHDNAPGEAAQTVQTVLDLMKEHSVNGESVHVEGPDKIINVLNAVKWIKAD